MAPFCGRLCAEDVEASVKGLDWLIAQQAKDGGWHSTTYGQLKDGAGVTSLALYAIAHAPPKVRGKYREAVRRGYAFLEPGLATKQTIASPDGSLDYPTYAGALWLAGRTRHRLDTPTDLRRATVLKYLLDAQVAEARGFAADSPSYGGWDFLGADDARGITTGTNISVTAYVLEAIVGSGAKEVRTRAIDWTLSCQQVDGGFAFTPEPMSLSNKAGFGDEERLQPRSYGTATCDGIRALLAAGMKPEDEPVRKAVLWLAKRPGVELVPGFESLPLETGWQRGLRFYYAASLAKCLPHFPQPDQETRSRSLSQTLIEAQRVDGSWQNESNRMREDDPLIATSLALIALGELSP